MLELARLYSDEQRDGVVVTVTQEDIAGLAGTSRATVNQVLREEERRGALERRRGKIVLLDVDALDLRAR